MAEAPGAPVPGRAASGLLRSASRLPVRAARAKRPAAAQEAAGPPEQKRARPGPAAPRPAERVPLRALSVAAAARAVPPPVPRKATATRAAPRGGAAPSAPPSRPPRRPQWDLKGQISDLRAALDASRSRADALEKEKQTLQHHLGEEMGRLRREHEEEMEKLKEEHEAELGRSRERQELQLQALQQELGTVKQQLQEEAARAEAEIRGLADCLREKEVQLQQAQGQLQQSQAQLQQRDERLHALEMERRSLHNALQELKGNIRVFCRVRPLLPEEAARQAGMGHLSFLPPDHRTLVLVKNEESRVGREGSCAVRHEFTFDRVFPPGATQLEVFAEVSSLVQSALDGFPVCIFAYGQTGSGKTYTMEGPDPRDPRAAGLLPRALRCLFLCARDLAQHGWQYEFSASYLEIYNESLRDLLAAPGEPPAALGIRRRGPSGELHVPNLHRVPVACQDEVLQLLQRASAQRSVARTGSNERSSRSHGVFQLHIRGANARRDVRCSSVLSLVDLAGSERLEKGGAPGERLRETQAINSSLSALGLVILALSRKEPHVPYRNSKLTHLLQNSLGGSAKMLMIVNISPLEENFNESLNSLRFASKVNECVIGTARANWK